MLSPMNLYLILLVSVVLFLYWWRKPHRKFPPGPRGVPILGVLPFLDEFPQRTFRKWSRKYGPVMSVRMADKDVVFLNTFDVITQALIRQKDVFSGRPPIDKYNQVLGHKGLIFVDYDEKQKSQRKFALQALKHFGMGKTEMEYVINDELEYFMNYLSSKVDVPIDFSVELINITCNMMTTLVLGRRFNYEDSTIKTIMKHGASKPGDDNLLGIILYFYKYVRYLPPFCGANRRFIEGEINVAKILLPMIEEHKATFNKTSIRDITDSYLYEQEFGSEKNKKYITDSQLKGCVRDLISAGSGDTRLVLLWDLLALLVNPDYRQAIVEEIDTVIGPTDSPSMSHRKRMPIMSSFLQEVWRYCPIVPNGVMHRTTADTQLYGFHIPKGTHVAPNIFAAHYDPKVWREPEVFDPRRHLDETGRFVPSNKIIPCSVGPRMCLGESLTHCGEFLILARLLQKFTLDPSTEMSLPPLDVGNNALTYCPRKFMAVLKLR